MGKEQLKQTPTPHETLVEQHLLSDDAPLHLPMAYAQWLPAVDERTAGRIVKKGSGKRTCGKGAA